MGGHGGRAAGAGLAAGQGRPPAKRCRRGIVDAIRYLVKEGIRRTVRDYERLPEHHETIVYWAVILTMSRRLARGSPSRPQAI